MHNQLKIIITVLGIAGSTLLVGCTTTEYIPSEGRYRRPKKGVYHKVKEGETIWRIAKTYNIAIKDIVRSNHIPNVAHIEEGQLIYVPHVEAPKEVILDENSLDPNEFSWPIKGRVISYFGQLTDVGVNQGIDIQARGGDTVYASRGGKVVLVDQLSGYAQTVILDHEDGYFTVYAQNSSPLVKLGEHINKGTPIAHVSRSNRLAFVHFEIRKKDVPSNPLYYLP